MADDVIHPWANEHDQGPAITIVTIFCLSLVLLVFGIRLWIRLPLASLFRYDDWTAAAATAIATVQSILILIAVRDGLGKRMDNNASRTSHVLNITFSGSVLYILALVLGKLAVALLIMRIGFSRGHRWTTGSLAAAIIAWGVGSIIAVVAAHDSTRPSESTHGSLNRWIAIECIGLAVEIAILIIMGLLVSNLTASREIKMAVFMGFFMRVGLFAIVPLRLYYISGAYGSTAASYTFAATVPELLTQIEMHYNVLGATVPCLRIFLKHFSSGYLGGVGLDAPDKHHSWSATNNATKGSFTGTKRNRPYPKDHHIIVETSVSIEMQGRDPSRGSTWLQGRQGDPFNDRASERSSAPLNLH